MSGTDRLAITDLLYRYAELVDAGDFDGVGELLGGGSFCGVRGAEPIAALFAATTRRFADTGTPKTRHLVLNPIVEVDGGTATARSTFCVVQATDTVPLQLVVVGRYFDSFGRDPAGGWFFTARDVDVEMVGDVSAHMLSDSPAEVLRRRSRQE